MVETAKNADIEIIVNGIDPLPTFKLNVKDCPQH